MENNIEFLYDRLDELKRQRATISREIHEVEEKIRGRNKPMVYNLKGKAALDVPKVVMH